MQRLFSLLGRSRGSQDRIRESTAMTTLYLLEMNRKFETYMRDKVDELEKRVAAAQSRPGKISSDDEPAELWNESDGEPAVEPEPTPEPAQADLPKDVAEEDAVEAESEPAQNSFLDDKEVDETEPEPLPSYMSLLGGVPENETEGEAEPEPEPDHISSPEDVPMDGADLNLSRSTRSDHHPQSSGSEDILTTDSKPENVFMLGGHTAIKDEQLVSITSLAGDRMPGSAREGSHPATENDENSTLEEIEALAEMDGDGNWENDLSDEGPKDEWS